ncbi:MAG TPA: peroxiredoxin-like family protein [Caulobacteraceae bacterium]|nr:peroxiredoxin-like family protein [Caulobacteraceae bacterium]
MDDLSDPPHPFAALEVALEQARRMDAPLNERMGLIADTVRALSAEFAEAVDGFVGRLQSARAGAGAPQVGDPMPPFLLPDENGRLVGLPSLLGRGPLVIAFHRGHWCPYCRLDASALVETKPRLGGAQMVAITPELQRHTLELKAETLADFPILSDMDNGYALSLNLAVWVDDAMASMIDAAGWNIPTYNGADSWVLPIPATFVVGSDGVITARDIDPDYRRRMDIEALVEAVKRTR